MATAIIKLQFRSNRNRSAFLATHNLIEMENYTDLIAGNGLPDIEFDTIIGHIEDMLVGENFNEVVSEFLELHWQSFDRSEENKLIYTDIFCEYTRLVEEYITNYLAQRIPGFSMQTFLNELQRKTNLDGEIFDILFTMSDFLKFKEFILDFRNTKESSVPDLVLTNSNHHIGSN